MRRGKAIFSGHDSYEFQQEGWRALRLSDGPMNNFVDAGGCAQKLLLG